MSGASAFFILIPAMYLLFTAALGTIALFEKKLIAARWAALGFGVAFVSILVDGYREPGGNGWISWFTVTTHFLPLLIMVQAFLTRLSLGVPRWIVGFVVVSSIFVMPDMPWAPPSWFRGVFVQAACTIIIATGLPALYRFRKRSSIDLLAFLALAGAAASYAARSIVIYLNPIGETRAEQAAFYEGLNLAFHAASALMGMTVGFVLMMTIGFDIVRGRSKVGEVDPLTRLGNRRRFERRIEQDESGARPAGGALVIDLDHFKQVNDTYGHEAGDDVLKEVGRSLKRIFRGRGVVCRTGGEEFIIIIDDAHADATSFLALAIREAIAAIRVAHALGEIGVTASVGYHVRRAGEDVTQAVRLADQAVYCAKKNGRNRVVGAVNENGLNVLRDVA